MVARARWIGLGLLAVGCARDDGLIHVRYMAWGNPQQLALEKGLCDEFTRGHPGVRVDFIQTPSANYHDKMVLMLASHTAPDVMRVDRYDFPALVAKDYFRPLGDLAGGFRADDYLPIALSEGRFRGRLYALDVLFGAPVVYYNKDLLRRAGLEEPYALWRRGAWTPDAYRRYALAMTTRKGDKPLTFGSWIAGLPFQCAVVYAFGGDVMRDERVCLAEDKAAEAMRFLHDLRFVDRAEPNASQTANSAFTFDGGKVGMEVEWMGITPRLRETATFDWDVCPLPMRPGGTTMVKGNALAMSAETRHTQEAWAFMRFLTSRATERKLYVDLRRSFPTRRDVALSPEYLASGRLPPHHLDAFVDSVERGRTMPITSRWGEWTTEFNGALEPLFNGTSHDVDGTLREAERRANETLSVREGL